ncbi:MAG: hypothetical protein ACI93R_003062 [Flavobacteriales bacterium]|jgi:hypothetical protein
MPIHIYLHGGVRFSSKKVSSGTIKRLKKLRIDDTISVYPSAWGSSKWWYESQAKNITKIIETLKEDYNIDENKIFIHGVSDGASGAYYFASHMPTPFAGFVALIGSPGQLSGKKTFGTTFVANFTNTPILSVNTRKDPIFSASSVTSFFKQVNSIGGDITFHLMAGKHDMNWFGKKQKEIRDFATLKVRNPYPDLLRWQVDSGGEFPRVHWLVVNNPLDIKQPSITEVKKQNNVVRLSSLNVSSVTLLISPDHFNLEENIQVWANQSIIFDQKVVPDINVLNKWFNSDKDRSMLFAAEITLNAPNIKRINQ